MFDALPQDAHVQLKGSFNNTNIGRNVVTDEVSYSSGKTDEFQAVIWVTPQGITHLAKQTNIKYNPKFDLADQTVDINDSVYPAYAFPDDENKFQATAVLSPESVKKGNKIYLGAFDQNYKEYTYSLANIPVYDAAGDPFGVLKVYNPSNTFNALYIEVTTDKEYSTPVNVAVAETASSALWHDQNLVDKYSRYIRDTPNPYDYSGKIHVERYIQTMGKPEKINKITRTISSPEYINPKLEPAAPSISINPDYSTADIYIPSYGYVEKATSDIDAKILQNWNEFYSNENHTMSNLPEHKAFHQVYKLSLENKNAILSPDSFHLEFQSSPYILDTNAKVIKTNTPLKFYSGVEKSRIKTLEDNLTSEQVYKSLPPNSFGISKQADGSYIIGFNVDYDFFKVEEDKITRLINSNAYAALSKDRDKIIKENFDAYSNLASTPIFWNRGFVTIFWDRTDDADGLYILQNVTPNQDVETTKKRASFGQGSADGKLLKRVSLYFVDDDNGGAVVGNIHTYKGEPNTDVSIDVATPNGYELVDGQTIPNSYQLKDQNDDIVIHVKHKTDKSSGSKTVTETIHYVDESGNNLHVDYTSSKTLTKTDSKDLVIGSVIKEGAWSTDTFEAVPSPNIDGYELDQAEIQAVQVDGNSQDIEKTVVYRLTKRNAKITFIDDSTTSEVSSQGKIGCSIVFSDYDSTLAKLKEAGYEFVSSDFNGQAYDKD